MFWVGLGIGLFLGAVIGFLIAGIIWTGSHSETESSLESSGVLDSPFWDPRSSNGKESGKELQK